MIALWLLLLFWDCRSNASLSNNGNVCDWSPVICNFGLVGNIYFFFLFGVRFVMDEVNKTGLESQSGLRLNELSSLSVGSWSDNKLWPSCIDSECVGSKSSIPF